MLKDNENIKWEGLTAGRQRSICSDADGGEKVAKTSSDGGSCMPMIPLDRKRGLGRSKPDAAEKRAKGTQTMHATKKKVQRKGRGDGKTQEKCVVYQENLVKERRSYYLSLKFFKGQTGKKR